MVGICLVYKVCKVRKVYKVRKMKIDRFEDIIGWEKSKILTVEYIKLLVLSKTTDLKIKFKELQFQ